MFKFLKSKKGFTLVELMIVVVIMAILVAVAVPIYSAVTKNARIKTCRANQREIQSQLNSAIMSDLITVSTSTKATLKTNAGDTDGGTWTVTGAPEGAKALSSTNIEKLFQKVPFCPVKGATISVSFETSGLDGSEANSFQIITKCDQPDHDGYTAPTT
jgi:prepilin-type N-terminal cleavage/methylation domain-containing protein